jgi:hypothetical protein
MPGGTVCSRQERPPYAARGSHASDVTSKATAPRDLGLRGAHRELHRSESSACPGPTGCLRTPSSRSRAMMLNANLSPLRASSFNALGVPRSRIAVARQTTLPDSTSKIASSKWYFSVKHLAHVNAHCAPDIHHAFASVGGRSGGPGLANRRGRGPASGLTGTRTLRRNRSRHCGPGAVDPGAALDCAWLSGDRCARRKPVTGASATSLRTTMRRKSRRCA